MKQRHLQRHRKSWKRVVSVAAALTLTAGYIPMDAVKVMATEMNAAAEMSSLKFPAELIAAVQEYGGDQYDAEEVLYTLYKQGVIDKNGDVLPVSGYNIDGQNVSEDELRAMISLHRAEDPVMAEGEMLTWGQVALLLTYKDYLTAIGKVAQGIKSGEIDLNDSTRDEMKQSLQRDVSRRFKYDGKNLVLPKSDADPQIKLPRVDDEIIASTDRSQLIFERTMPTMRLELGTVEFKPSTITSWRGLQLTRFHRDLKADAIMNTNGNFTISASLDGASADRTTRVYFKIHVVDGMSGIKLKTVDGETIDSSEGWMPLKSSSKLYFESEETNCYREFELELYSPDVKIDTDAKASDKENLHYGTATLHVYPSISSKYLTNDDEDALFRQTDATRVPAYVWGDMDVDIEGHNKRQMEHSEAYPPNVNTLPQRYYEDGMRVRLAANGKYYELALGTGVAVVSDGGLYDDDSKRTNKETFTMFDGNESKENVFWFHNDADSNDVMVLDLAEGTLTRASTSTELSLILHPQSTLFTGYGCFISYFKNPYASEDAPAEFRVGAGAYYCYRDDETPVAEWTPEYLLSQELPGNLFVDSVDYDGEFVTVKMKDNCSLSTGLRDFQVTCLEATKSGNKIEVPETGDLVYDDLFTVDVDRARFQESINKLPIARCFTLEVEDDSGKNVSYEASTARETVHYLQEEDDGTLEQDTMMASDGCQYLRFRVGKDKNFKLKSIRCNESFVPSTSPIDGDCTYYEKYWHMYSPENADVNNLWYFDNDTCRTQFDLSSFNVVDAESNVQYFPSNDENEKPFYDTTSLATMQEYLFDFSKATKSNVTEKSQFVYNESAKTLTEVTEGGFMNGTLIEYRIPMKTDTKGLTLEAEQWIADNVLSVEGDSIKNCRSYVPTMYVDDGTNMQDTKVYCHYTLEPIGQVDPNAKVVTGTPKEVDYLYFYVESTTPGVDYTGTAYLHGDFSLTGDDLDDSNAEYALPRVDYAFPYSFKATVPFFYQMDKLENTKSVNLGKGDVYYTPSAGYDQMMSRASEMTDWAKERVYLYYNPMYNIPLTSYDNLTSDYAFNTYKVQTADDNLMESGKTYGSESVPKDASMDLKQIGLQYSDGWLEMSDSLGGSLNGIPMHYWKRSTIQAAEDAIQTAGGSYGSWRYFDLFRTAPYTNYYSTFEKNHDVYTAPFINEADHDGDFFIDKLSYQKAVTEAGGEYPLSLIWNTNSGKTSLYETVSTKDVSWYSGSEEVSYSHSVTRGTGYDTPSALNWIAEFTDKSTGKTSVIQPGDLDGAVEFSVDPSTGRLTVTDFSDSMEGTICFKLRVANSPAAMTAKTQSEIDALVEGKDYVTLTSGSITLSATSETYLIVPSASKQIQVYQDDTAAILFSNNIARRNEAFFGVSETKYRVQLFELDADRNRVSDTPIYEAEDVGTYQNTLTKFQIPEDVLSKISSENGFSYEAVISASLAKNKEGKQDYSDSALIQVVERPVKFVFGEMNGYTLNSQGLEIKYHTVDAAKNFNGTYSVVRKSDNVEVMHGALTSDAASGNEMTISIPTTVLTIPNGSLKDYFVINLNGRNSADGTYSIASAIANVYNDGSMTISIGNDIVGDGESYTLSKRSFVKDNMSSNEHTVALSDKLTMAQLQEELRLVDDVSISTKNGAFGSLSDVIKWYYQDTHAENEKESGLYYTLFGDNNQIEDDGKLLIPNMHLALMGSGDGSGSIKAIHANTGMTTEVDVTIDDVEQQLYLFQFLPAVTTTVTYTNGKGETRNFTTNNKGQIAIYEEDGFQENGLMYTYSEQGRYFYKNTFETCNFKSGAGNAAKNELYPVNLCKLKKGYTVFVTIPEAKNKTVTIRGAAYKNAKKDDYGRIDLKRSTYAEAADLLIDKATPDDGNGVSNGLEGVQFQADKNGTFTIYFDSQQIYEDSENEESASTAFAFEAEMDGYYTVPFEITQDFGEVTMHMNEASTPVGVQYLSQEVYYSNSKRTSDVSKDVEYIGRTANSDEVRLLVTTVFHGMDDLLTKENGQTKIADGAEANVRYINRSTRKEIGAETGMQDDYSYVYPFSTTLNNFLVMTVNEKKLSWLEENHYAQMSLCSKYSGNVLNTSDVCYNLLNGEIIEDLDPDEVGELQETLQEQLTGMDNGPLGALNQDGLAGQAVTSFTSTVFSLINNGKFPVNMQLNCVVLPTADPTSFEILMGINAMDEFLQDSEVDSFATAEAKKTFLNKTDTATAGNAGSGTESEVKKVDPTIAGYLKEGTSLTSDQFNDYVEEFRKKEQQDKDEEEGKDSEDDDDDDPKIKITPVLYGIMEAKYDVKEQTWDYSYKGFNLGVDVEAEKEIMKENMLVGPGIPIYVEIKGMLGASLSMGQKYITVDESAVTKDGIGEYKKEDTEGVFLTRLGVKFGLSVFAGLGADSDLIGVVFGLEVEGGISLDFALLIGIYGDGNTQYGMQAGIDLNLACKFVAHCLMFSYEATLFEVGASASIGHEQYQNIQNLWSNAGKKTSRPQFYNPRMDQLQSMSISGADDNTLRLELNTVQETVPKMRTMAKPQENLFAMDSDTIESVVYSKDGQMILFLDNNVASYANGSGVIGGSVVPADDEILGVDGGDSKPIPENGNEMSEAEKELVDSNPEAAADGETVKNFGDYYAALSGSDGVYYAAWTQQRNETTKEKLDSAEVNLDDLAIAMNSTETIVSVYRDGVWTTQKLTNNFQPDMTPSIAGVGDHAVVVWKNSYSTNAEDPLKANSTETLVYSIYNGTEWSEAATLYDGSFGGITGYETAMLQDGTTVVAYTVQTSTDNTEVFYSMLTADGTVSVPTRLTMNASNEVNLQVTTAGENFVLGWFDTEERDIELMCIQADGTFDNAFPECVSKAGYTTALSDIFTISGGDNLTDFSVFWSAKEAMLNDEGETDYIETSVYGAKLFVLDDTTKGMTPPQLVKTLDDRSLTVSALTAMSDSEGNDCKLLLTETKFESVPVYVTPEAAGQMLVSRLSYNTDEEYNAALEAKIAELEGNTEDGYVKVTTAKAVTKYDSESFTFKENLSLDNAEYDKNAVIPNLDTMLLLTLTNDGVTPINKIRINNETEEVLLDEPLLPGESVFVPYQYTVGEKVRDIDFHITADNTTDADAAAEGTLSLDAPQLEVLGYDMQANEGTRTLNLQLNNTVAIPLATSEKKLVVRVYADQEKKELIKEKVVSDKDLLTNIDDGMGNVEVTMTVAEIMEHANISEEEIPAQGIPVYVEAVVESEDNVFSMVNRTVVVETMRTDEYTPFGMETVTEFGENTITVSSAVTNQSLQEKYLCNVSVVLYDADGNVIAEKNTNNDISNLDTFRGEQTIADAKYNVTFTVGEDLTAEQFASVAYAEAGAYGDVMHVTFDMGIADDVENEEAETVLGTAVTMPETPVSEWGEFEGWYADEALTEAYNPKAAVCRNLTLYAKWTVPNLDVTTKGCFLGADGKALTYDAETRTLLTAAGENPTVNADALSVVASKIHVLDENGKAITGSDNTWFDIEWLDKDGKPVTTPENAGDYTLNISPTETGKAGGASGTLIIHVTVEPYQLSVTGVVPESRSYDGTYDVTLDCTNAELVAPTEEGFFHGDDVQLELDDSVIGTADQLVGSTTVTFSAKLTGEDAANYTLGEGGAVTAKISPRTLKLEWGTMDGENFTAGTDAITLGEDGKAVITARPTNLVEGDDVKVVCTNDSTTSVYTDLTTTANKLEGKDAANYQLSSSAKCTWQAKSNKFVLHGATLTLNGTIGVNYYTYIPKALLEDSKAYILLSSGDNTEKVKLSTLTPEADGRYKLTYSVAVKEMTDDITLQVRTGENGIVPLSYMSGKAISNNCFTYSVADYLSAVQGDTTGQYSSELHQLTAAMQDLGSCAQDYFDYNTENKLPVSDDLANVTVEMLEDYRLTRSGDNGGQFTLKSASLVLETDTALRLFFTGNASSIARWKVTVNGQELPIQQRGTTYYVELSNISAADLNESYVFEFTNGSYNYSVTYSALSYAATVLSQYSYDTKLANTARALYLYSCAADRYFGR